MAFNKNLDAYPEVLTELITRLDAGSPAITVPFLDRTQAIHTRFTFYDFKKALRHSDTERGKELCRMAERVAVTLRGDCLIFSSRDRSAEALAIAGALAKMGNVPGIDADIVTDEITRLNGIDGGNTPFNPPHNTKSLITITSPPVDQFPVDQEYLLDKFFPRKD